MTGGDSAQPAEAAQATHFDFARAVYWPSELTIEAYVNSVSARKGECLGHVKLGPVELTLHSPGEARRIAAAFTVVADGLDTVQNGTWSDNNELRLA